MCKFDIHVCTAISINIVACNSEIYNLSKCMLQCCRQFKFGSADEL